MQAPAAFGSRTGEGFGQSRLRADQITEGRRLANPRQRARSADWPSRL